MNRTHRIVAGAVAVLCGALVLWATRDHVRLSPDSMSYLAAAQHLHDGRGVIDITGEPLTVFAPLYPLLLAPGGAALGWARVVGAASAVAATVFMFLLLARRVRPWVAVAGAAGLGLAQGLLNVTATVWSEGPYIAISLATLVVLSAPAASFTTRRAALCGVLAGLGLLTRYAGVGLVVTGFTMVAAGAVGASRSVAVRRLGAFLAASIVVAGSWLLRNAVGTGEVFGPRGGGSTEPLSVLLKRPLLATGQLVVGVHRSVDTTQQVGLVVIVAVVVLAVVAVTRRPWSSGDTGVAVFALLCVVVPVVGRVLTANDIESRVMSPMVVPIVYVAVVGFDRLFTRRWVAVVGAALLAWWGWQGVALADRFPGLPTNGARDEYSAALHDAIDALPPDAVVLTNNLHRVWFIDRREPTLFAFTRPRPGNSHYPLSAQETLVAACTGRAHLAWFRGLFNAGPNRSPQELRPDVAALVDLQLERRFGSDGELYLLRPVDAAMCPPPDRLAM